MEQLVQVRDVYDDGTAQVVCIRESACSGDCHKCSGCGAQQQAMVFDAVNAIGCRKGSDLVDFINKEVLAKVSEEERLKLMEKAVLTQPNS